MNQRHEFRSKTDARAWVKEFSKALQRPTVVLLDGDLGAGKTQFVRWILEDLKAFDVASPTFAIHHEYATPSGPVDHVDLYRVNSDADLEATGFWDLFTAETGLVFVEWASRLPEDAFPRSWSRIALKLEKTGTDERRVLTVRLTPPSPKSGP